MTRVFRGMVCHDCQEKPETAYAVEQERDTAYYRRSEVIFSAHVVCAPCLRLRYTQWIHSVPDDALDVAPFSDARLIEP